MIVREWYVDQFDTILEDRVNSTLASIKTRKQRFRVSRVPEDMRNVSVVLDVQEGNMLLRDSFEWNLNDWNISPREFIGMFCSRLKIGDQQERLYRQLIFQLMDYIERHQFQDPLKSGEFQKPQKKKQTAVPKPTARQQRIQRRVTNKKCCNCEFANNSPGIDCRKCLLPFHITDIVNKSDPIQEACLVYFEVAARTKLNYISSKEFRIEDFKSLYSLKAKLVTQAHNSMEEKGVEQAFQELMKTKDVALYRAMQLPDEMNKENQSQQQDEEQEELGEEQPEKEEMEEEEKEKEEKEEKEQERVDDEEEQMQDSKTESKKSQKSRKSATSKKNQEDEQQGNDDDQQIEDAEDDQEDQNDEEDEDENDNDEEDEEKPEKTPQKRDRTPAPKPRRSIRAMEKRLKRQRTSLRQKYRY